MTNRLRDLNEALPEILVIDLLYLIIGEIVIFLLFENPGKICSWISGRGNLCHFLCVEHEL